nr:Uncharacterised protein [Klebsiella pneumoniae]
MGICISTYSQATHNDISSSYNLACYSSSYFLSSRRNVTRPYDCNTGQLSEDIFTTFNIQYCRRIWSKR